MKNLPKSACKRDSHYFFAQMAIDAKPKVIKQNPITYCSLNTTSNSPTHTIAMLIILSHLFKFVFSLIHTFHSSLNEVILLSNH